MKPDDHDDDAALRQLLEFDLQPDTGSSDQTVRELHAELETLARELRHAPLDAAVIQESECTRAIELASSVADGLSSHASKTTAKDKEPDLGQLGPYELLELIGRGGMGAVYKARHLRLNKVVALKVVASHRAENDDAMIRFDREMKAVGMLDHPNLVRALDAGDADGKHYLVMEYVDGCDLARLLRERGPLPIAEACELILQAAKGLQVAHARGMIHRDVKPANLILARQDFSKPIVKVLDLGLALLAEHHLPDQHGLTSATQIMGSIDYMAPEQASDSHAVDARADVYGLGATLFALLTGGSIFSQQPGRTLLQKLTILATGSAPSVRDRRPEVSQQLADIVGRMIARDPDERFESMSSVIAALQPFAAAADLESLLAESTSVSSRETQLAVDVPTIQIAPVRPAPAKRRWIPITLAAALASLLVGMIVVNIQTPQGEIVVEIPDGLPRELADQIHVNVRGQGKVQVADQKSGWTIDAHEGSYDIDLQGSSDRVQLKDKRVTVTRNRQTLVRLTHQSAGSAPPAASPQASINIPKTAQTQPEAAPPSAIAPFDAPTAQQHQEAWAKHLNLPIEFENSVGMKFRLVPPGEYMMGTSQDELNRLLAEAQSIIQEDERYREGLRSESPPCRVILPRPFYVGVHEVTQRQFYLVMGKSPSAEVLSNAEYGPRLKGIDTAQFPVESVSWYDMLEFCELLSQGEQLEPFAHRSGELAVEVKRGTGYRLPSEAEWEYACRAGTTTRYYTGDKDHDADQAAWYQENNGARLHTVGQRDANAFGLYDMLGNVGEATLDSELQRPALHTGKTPGVYSVPDSPPVSDTVFFISRGGDMLNSSLAVRSAYRWVEGVKEWGGDRSGFRVVLPVDSARKTLNIKDSDPAGIDIAHRRATVWLHTLKNRFVVEVDNKLKVVEVDDPLPVGKLRIHEVILDSAEIDALGKDLVSAVEKNFRGVTFGRLQLSTSTLDPNSVIRLLQLPAFREVEMIITRDVSVTDAILAQMVKLPRFANLSFMNSSRITEEGIRQLSNQPELTSLTLLRAAFKPQALAHLREMPKLAHLNLDGLTITTEHADQLIPLRVTSLRLPNCSIDDNRATQLARMSGLTSLYLRNNPLTDEGLAVLAQLTGLKSLDVTETKVTPEGLQKFRQALPKCKVVPE